VASFVEPENTGRQPIRSYSYLVLRLSRLGLLGSRYSFGTWTILKELPAFGRDIAVSGYIGFTTQFFHALNMVVTKTIEEFARIVCPGEGKLEEQLSAEVIRIA
jgi:hypothetical protein